MSPSLLVFDERHEPFRDQELFALVALADHLLDEGVIDPALSDTVAAWKRDMLASGFGAIDFDFSAFPAGSPRHDLLQAALVSAEAYMRREWQAVPRAVLDRFDQNVMRFERDVPIEWLIDVLRRLRRLLGDPAAAGT